MTTFEEREKAFEKKFALDQDLKFRAESRRNKMVAEWAAAKLGIRIVVLDRPNPITGRVIEGPVMDADLRSFTAPHPIPVRPGMTIAIEPMINIGRSDVEWLDNDWTVVTQDGTLSAHYENTVLITEGDPEILTLVEGNL